MTSISIAPADIADALKQFNITDGDYYLEFTDNTIYLHWVTSLDQVQQYIDDLKECLDVQLYNHWIDTYGSYESGHTVLLPEEDFFHCRYILGNHLILNIMKTIYSMGKGKYVTLDSYSETHETRLGSIGVALLALLLAAITGMALVGVDPTNINPQPTQQNNETAHRTNR